MLFLTLKEALSLLMLLLLLNYCSCSRPLIPIDSLLELVALRRRCNEHALCLLEAAETRVLVFFRFINVRWLDKVPWHLNCLVVIEIGDQESLLIGKVQVHERPLNHEIVHDLWNELIVADSIQSLHAGLLLLVAEREDEDEVLAQESHSITTMVSQEADYLFAPILLF